MDVSEKVTLKRQLDQYFILLAICLIVVLCTLCAALAALSHYRISGTLTHLVVSSSLFVYETAIAVFITRHIFDLIKRIEQS